MKGILIDSITFFSVWGNRRRVRIRGGMRERKWILLEESERDAVKVNGDLNERYLPKM